MNLEEQLAKFAALLPDHDVSTNDAAARLQEAFADYEMIETTIEHFRGDEKLSPTENEVLVEARREAVKKIALRGFLLWRGLSKEKEIRP